MTMTLEGVRGQPHAPATICPRERPGTHCTGVWVGLRAGLDRCKNLAPIGIQSPDHPARSQLLYWLHYLAHNIWKWVPWIVRIKASFLIPHFPFGKMFKDILVCVNYVGLGVCDTVFLLWSARVRNKAPCLMGNNMINIVSGRGCGTLWGDSRVWSTGGFMVGRGKLKKLRKCVLHCHFWYHESYMQPAGIRHIAA
jgi:hypothetical protein